MFISSISLLVVDRAIFGSSASLSFPLLARIHQSLGLLEVFVHIRLVLVPKLGPNSSFLEVREGLCPNPRVGFVCHQRVHTEALFSDG
jgi:hypothetical protein